MDHTPQPYGLAARLSIGLTGLLFAGIVVALFLVDVQLRYDAAIDAARKDTQNYVQILAEHTALTFAGIDSALHEAEAIRLNGVRGAYETPDAMHRALGHVAQTSPAMVAIGWTDARGDLVAHSYDRSPPRSNIAEMAHFAVQRDQVDAGLYIAPPYRSAAGSRWLSAVSRRLNNPDGSFAGIVTAPIDQSYFNKFYRSVDLGSAGSIMLLHRGGRIMVREPVVAESIGKSLTDSPLLSERLPKAESGSFDSISPVDGIARIVSYKAVAGLPLVVLVTHSRDEVLTPWRSFVWGVAPIVGLIVFCVLVGTWLLLRQTRSLAAQTHALAWSATSLERTNLWFDAALSNMSQGLCLFDAEQRLVICNNRFREIYGYPQSLTLPGTPLKSILSYLVARGAKQGDMTVDDYIAGLKAQPNETFFNLDGKIISIVRAPTPDGGWVATHEDVTEQKRSERLLAERAAELRTVNERFSAAINNMSQGLCLVSADRSVLMSNQRFSEIYDLPPDLVRPGLSGEVLIREIAARGFTPDDMSVEEFEALAPDRRTQSIINQDGRTISILRTQIPEGGWIATHEDVTEQRNAERLLATNATAIQRANERFDVAINNMPQGVCLFDAEQRVVVANTRYAELYHLDPEQVKAGVTLQQILDLRLQRGTNFATAPDVYRSVNVRKEQEIQELADGRTVSIVRRIMSDGGWLTTHDDITDRVQSERRIAYLAQHDMLTGLANRALFAEKLEEAAKRHKRHGNGFTVLMLDLDKFKAVNDTLGHAAGDQLLKEVASRLKASLRETDLLARLGGDEFAIIQDGQGEQRQAAVAVALRIIDLIGKPFDLDGHQVNVGTSIGIAFAPEHGDKPEELMKRADLALYAVKAAGRNDFRIFSDDMGRAEQAHRASESELRDAIKHEEFELHYQPIFEAAGAISGVEALVRWRHPLRGLLAPDQFIPLAESTGQIVPLGEWVLQRACREALTMPPHLRVAVNLSSVQFRKANLFDLVLRTLMETGLAAERLELEVTEGVLLDNQAAQLAALRQLKTLGVAIALDNFGAGGSSMKHLMDFPFDRVKIDKAVVQGAPKRRDRAAAVASILALAHGLGIAITAEGVETEDQAQYLRSAGVDFLQGYLLGRPQRLAELEGRAPVSREGLVA